MIRPLAAASALVACAGLLLAGQEVALRAKARLAALLIDRALTSHIADGGDHRPWPWADVVPLARLEVPRLALRRAVLSGASGAALAFGLGHVDGTAAPGVRGNVVIAGHRDGQAAFLERLLPGDEVLLHSRAGTTRCIIDETSVVPHDAPGVLDDGGDDRLTLVTCWPFGGWTRSPWRYVVRGDCHAGPPGPG